MDDASPIRTIGRDFVGQAWRRAVADGALPELPEGTEPIAVEIDRPAKPEHGDLASNIGLKLARPLRRSPIVIAQQICDRLAVIGAVGEGAPFDSAEVVPPGFLNLRVSGAQLERSLDAARGQAERFGRVKAPEGRQRINVEFVSANPTGPLTVGNARGAFVGDLLSRVLEAGGHEVTREYYFNDSNRQVDLLGASVAALRAGQSLPEEGYRGDYVADLARDLPSEVWARAIDHGADRDALIGGWAAGRIRAGIQASLDRLGVHFDVWKTESSLHDEGWVDRAIERLRAAGHLYELDGALWFRSTAFGDDKDRPVIRANGQPVYFAADIGYVTEKFSRSFNRLIYVWGADHHGTVARVRNAAEAMGYDREAVEMLLIAWVRFVRDGHEVSMSKRSGEFITLDELLTEVGVDAARWYFGARAHTTGIDFDIEAAKDQTAANPVHYVRYAHARICSILRKAAEADLAPAPSVVGTLLEDPIGQGLAKQVLRLPEVVEDAARAHETQIVTAYATELATALHAYYRDRRVVDPTDPATSAARLSLVDGARVALAATLGLLGISAPSTM